MTGMRDPLWFFGTRHGPFELAVGAGAVVAATVALGAFLPPEQASARLIAMTVAVGLCAAMVSRARIAVAVAGLGYLLFTGFLANTSGQLTGERLIGEGQFFAIALAALIGLGYRRLRAEQADALFDAEFRELLDNTGHDGDGREPPPRWIVD